MISSRSNADQGTSKNNNKNRDKTVSFKIPIPDTEFFIEKKTSILKDINKEDIIECQRK